jgi:dihydrofolate reductase
MRKLILQTGISIDGFVAATDGSHPWGYKSDDAADDWLLDTAKGAGAHLMGRVTYEEMAGHWPTSESRFAPPMNELPKVVFSKTLKSADWAGTTIASGDLAEEIARLKAEPGNDLVAYGGARLDQALSREGLVDEYRLMVHPAALGTGLPLFGVEKPLALELVEVQNFESGAAGHVYRPRA